ncbi:MAG: ABC transporter ATP-binding protein [Burkholderiales bacterium]|nr:ABC transporter ATP-binding protein [Burkholderiales bacterium]
MSLLELVAVSKRYGGVLALDQVSFTVEAGTIVGVMGANGAGKTTLFALIAGNERPSGGEVRFAGRSLAGLRPDQIARRGVARTFQVVRPFAGLSVRENVLAGALFGTRAFASAALARRAADAIVEEAGLGGQADRLAGTLTLSGQKRLEVARAIATGARLVMLDEVMAGLLPAEVDEMLATLHALQRARGLTLLVIEHVMQALMRLSQRIVVLHLGALIAQGSPEEVAADPEVQRLYFGETA